MAIPSINPAVNGTTPPADQISSRTEQTLNRADFMKLLMTQMRYQDPMSPMGNEELASQMAQFSSLQELQGIGSALEQSIQANLLMTQSFNNTMAASLIGKFVTAESNQFQLESSGGARVTYRLPSAATELSLEIRDAQGALVRTLNVNPQEAGDHAVNWDGTDSEGKRVPEGTYTFTVNAKDADGGAVAATTLVQGLVESVRYADGQVLLRVDGRDVALSAVLSLANDGGKGA